MTQVFSVLGIVLRGSLARTLLCIFAAVFFLLSSVTG